ncbi:hypothetical protein PC119_g14414 [Phytophthora cactorum]|nr:hypothetical protein PC119_g14414 [Phytophthora cactorum]
MVAESFTTVGPPALTEARREWFDSNARQVRAMRCVQPRPSWSVLAKGFSTGILARCWPSSELSVFSRQSKTPMRA